MDPERLAEPVPDPTGPAAARLLTTQQTEIVRATLPLIAAHIDQITAVFYRTLFGNHPALLRDLFNRANQADGSQARALAASIAHFATRLIDPALPPPEAILSRLSHRHASLGVTAAQYGVVHENLFAAMRSVIGPDVLTGEVAEAWDRVYWLMADALIGREARLYAGAGAAPGAVFREVTVVSRVEDCPGVVVFTVHSAEPDRPLPSFAPGQYVSVAARLPDGARQLRQYSLTGPPGQKGLEFAVKRIDSGPAGPTGEVSAWLHDRVGVGDRLEITLPFGDLTTGIGPASPLVLISAGIGIAPMIGILEHLVGRTPQRRVLLVHEDRSIRTHPLRERMLGLAARLPTLTLHLYYREPATGAHDGSLDPAGLDLPENADFVLCGGTDFLWRIRSFLRERRIPESRVHTEQFTPTDWRESAR